MEKEITERCVKMNLPNGKVVDILTPVFEEIYKWIQRDELTPESGGYIVGYQHIETGNISLETVSYPYSLDKRNRIHFGMKDPRHKLFLLKEKAHKSYYMGVWHTHPQLVPTPSNIDWNDWYKTLEEDQTGSNYVFFIIVGIKKMRVWVGDFEKKSIEEIFECKKNGNLYDKNIS